jgi:anti-anti-sigma factor
LEIIAVRVDATQSTIQAEGELDLATAGLLRDALDDELMQDRRFVRLDLSRLDFVDCVGLRVLVRAHHRFLAARGTLVLTGLGRRVARTLAITHHDDLLFIADGPGRPGFSGRGRPAAAPRRT